MRPKYMIIRKHDEAEEHNGHHDEERHYAEHKDEVTELEKKEYQEYIKKHGSHFSDALADWASTRMKNRNGEAGHHWTVAEVKSAFERLGYQKPETSTWGDIAYSANMAYADYLGESIKTDVDCIKHAYADVSDPDGYPGKIFNRWVADVMGKGEDVSWGDFM